MKVYKQFYRKTILTLIAEIGGYLGLFLGWSGLAFVTSLEKAYSKRHRYRRRSSDVDEEAAL